MQNPLANFIGVFSLVRDVQGFQVNPLCRHDLTRSDRQIGNSYSLGFTPLVTMCFCHHNSCAAASDVTVTSTRNWSIFFKQF